MLDFVKVNVSVYAWECMCVCGGVCVGACTHIRWRLFAVPPYIILSRCELRVTDNSLPEKTVTAWICTSNQQQVILDTSNPTALKHLFHKSVSAFGCLISMFIKTFIFYRILKHFFHVLSFLNSFLNYVSEMNAKYALALLLTLQGKITYQLRLNKDFQTINLTCNSIYINIHLSCTTSCSSGSYKVLCFAKMRN